MAHNHLEQLIAEWYEYQGYFVKRNVLVGPLAGGGFECELDVVAFHPGNPDKKINPHLVHLEPSLDADSWAIRERRYKKKFSAGRNHIKKELFPGLPLPEEIEQIAVLVFASNRNHPPVGGGRVVTVDQLLKEIFVELDEKRLESKAISERWPILRTLQYVSQYRDVVMKVWNISQK
jgi:hypothetical protein